MGGKPSVRGMRETVGMIVGLVASGRTFAKSSRPVRIWRTRISGRRSLYAAWRVEEIEVPLPAA